MVLREQTDSLNHSRGIMGPLENSTGVQNNRGRLKQRFDLIRKLGQGTYGKVQLGIDKETGQEVAIKTIKKSKIETEADLIRIQREIQIMSSVRHPNIIHIYEVFENREKMVLVMEYAAGGELYDYLNERKTLKDDEARRIFRQIASATYYCHKHNICHRDLKLENILLDEKSNAKIADFGLSNVFDDVHLLKTFCGSPLYASPEIVRGTPYYGPEVDCWSLGVLLYTLVYGAMPFDGSNFKRLVKQISNGDYYEPSKKAEASGLIRLMLTVDPLKRATIKDVCSHSWINHGFSDQCLKIAEELANQTPVRLDLLLSLAPGANINPAVTEKSAVAGAAPVMKPKSKAELPAKSSKIEGEPKVSKTPNDVKKKQSIKKKSKSSPLLELIVDVEEEKEHDLDDDVGDTLSEISEIQTIAEEPLPKDPKEKECKKDVISTKPLKEPAKVLTEQTSPSPKSPKEPKQTQVEKKEELIPVVDKLVPAPTPEKRAVSPRPINEPKAKKDETLEKVKINSEVKAIEVSKADNKDKLPAKVETKKAEINKVETKEKPVEKTMAEAKAVESKGEKFKEEEVKEPKAETTTKVLKKKVVKPKEVDKVNKVEQAKPETVSSQKEQEKVSSGTDNEGSDTNKSAQKGTKIKQRSDSITGEGTSPTRIERRNSKVISQKTAELIQNLEAKTGTSSTDTGPKGKKVVIPSFKVSDAKSRFEVSPVENVPAPVKPAPKVHPVPNSTVENNLQKVKTSADSKEKVPEGREKPTVSADPVKIVQPKEEIKQKETPKALQPVTPKPKSKSPTPVPPLDKPKKVEAEIPKAVEIPTASEPEPSKKPVEKPNLKVKIIPIQPEVEASNKVPAKTGAATAPIQKSQVQATPTPTTPICTTPSAKTVQNKEQAAKKIGSVIQKIVSSESIEKGMNEKFPGTPLSGAPEKANFKTEIQKFINTPSGSESAKTQRTEVRFPVAAAGSQERIIPIQLTDEVSNGTANSSRNNSEVSINSRFPPRMDSMKSAYSRQNSSDTESSMTSGPPNRMESLKKSPREFIIPIKVEASGHTVTPKEELLNSESSITEDNFRLDSRLRPGRFDKVKRFNSILSDSSLEDEPISASSSRRTSAASGGAPPSHARSLSQGDEPSTPGTFKRYRRLKSGGLPLDKSDSFSSAEEDDEDTFEVLTAETLFSSLLDRVRNLTKRLNRESGIGNTWGDSQGFGMFSGHESPLQEFMSRAPSEVRPFGSLGGARSNTRSYSREPSVTVTISSGPSWRRSLSRDVSGESDSVMSEAVSRSSSQNARNLSTRPADSYDSMSTRSAPVMRRPSPLTTYMTPRSQPSQSPGLENPASQLFSRPGYRRTMSNTDYTTSVTLPFRRYRTYDRTMSTIDPTTSNPYLSTTNTTNQSPLPVIRDSSSSNYSSRPSDPSTRFEPGSPYLTRYRALNRYASTPEPDSRRPVSTINESTAPARANNSGEGEGWIGGSRSSCTRTTAAKMTTQEKMNSYQNYYQSLAQDPLKRVNCTNPSSPPERLPTATNIASIPSNLGSPPTENPEVANPTAMNGSTGYGSTLAKGYVEPNVPLNMNLSKNENQTQNTQTEAKVTTKWPSVSVKQYRPVSIPNFSDRSGNQGKSYPMENGHANPSNVFRPLSPPTLPTTSFVRAQAERLTSPPPEKDWASPEPKHSVGQKPKSDSNSNSVEKIKRAIERKSVPRDNQPQEKVTRVKSPPLCSPSSEQQPDFGESYLKMASGSKTLKPKFFQSLEKKWEKLTNKTDESSEPGTPEEDIDPSKESVLLQRAVSPEKKVKPKFGASTVNFMLGKFRKIEETAGPPSKQLTSKPPPAVRTGRRVQSVYAGAFSDGILTFPDANFEGNREKLNISTSPQSNSTQPHHEKVGTSEAEDIKTGKPLLKKPKRPLSLGIFSKDGEHSKSSSFIPRFGGHTPAEEKSKIELRQNNILPAPPPPTPLLEITVDCTPKINPEINPDENLLTPNSVSDNSSCSERTEVSAKSSILDEEESVSDRILRKSFYSRFNSADHKTPNSISPTTYSASGMKRYSPNRSSTTKLSLDSSKYSSSSSCLPSLSPKINKYNPNPLFRELITDDFKSDVDRRTEYSRRVTSKLSKLLRDIDTDISLCNGTASTNDTKTNGCDESKADVLNGGPSHT